MGSELADLILLFIFSLYLSGNLWFNRIAVSVSRVAFRVLSPVLVPLLFVLLNFRTTVKAVLKGAAVLLMAVLLGSVYLFSSVVPWLGRQAKPAEVWVRNHAYTRYMKFRVRASRDMLVEILADVDDQDLDFQDVERYREELANVKESGKRRLERGETLLSIFLGAALIGSQATDVELFRVSIYGLDLSFLVEVWLLVIAISIIYRVSILEFLSYPEDVSFESIEEFDAALSYQKMLALKGVAQGLFLLMVLIWMASNVRDDLVRSVLEEKYRKELSFREVVMHAHSKLQK